MAEDYSDSDSWYHKFPFWTGEIEDEGKLYLIGKTEQFLLYTTSQTDELLIETPDGKYYADKAWDRYLCHVTLYGRPGIRWEVVSV